MRFLGEEDAIPPFELVEGDLRKAEHYGVPSLAVSFFRELNDEETHFVDATEIEGIDHIRLLMPPDFWKPGGTVYLPAGTLYWRPLFGHLNTSVKYRPWDLCTKDHPKFSEDDWLQSQCDCARRMIRLGDVKRHYFFQTLELLPPCGFRQTCQPPL